MQPADIAELLEELDTKKQPSGFQDAPKDVQ